jgi:hypothetical protein
MTRAQLEHIIRAACTIADDGELIIVGSQSILAQVPNAPDELLVSIEADVYPRNRPERAELIEGSIGELSMFHETFGYYAQGVVETTAVLPAGWRRRLVRFETPATNGVVAWCLEPHDIWVSKAIAGRPKDTEFCDALVARSLVRRDVLRKRLAKVVALDPTVRAAVAAAIERA